MTTAAAAGGLKNCTAADIIITCYVYVFVLCYCRYCTVSYKQQAWREPENADGDTTVEQNARKHCQTSE